MNDQNIREYQFVDVIALFQHGWKWMAGFGLSGLIIGVAYAIFSPVTYEGRAQIELAKHGIIRNPYDLTYVSEPRLVVSKIRNVDFYDAATAKSCGIPMGADAAGAISRSIKPGIARGTSFIEVAVKSTNQDLIKTCLEGIFKKVEKDQIEALDKIDDKIVAKLKELESGMAKKEATIRELKTRSGAVVIYVDSGAADVLLDERFGGLRSYVDSRKRREPVFFNYEPPVKKAFPNNQFVLLVSLMLGFLAGIIAYLIKTNVARYKSQRSQSA